MFRNLAACIIFLGAMFAAGDPVPEIEWPSPEEVLELAPWMAEAVYNSTWWECTWPGDRPQGLADWEGRKIVGVLVILPDGAKP